MKFPKNSKQLQVIWAALFLAAASAAEAQYSFPATPGFGTPDPFVSFESVTYVRAAKSTLGSTRTYTIDASTRSSNVPDMSGRNYSLTWWADSTHVYSIGSGVWDLNFTGTSTTNTGSATAIANCTHCSLSIYGTGISSTADNMSWLASTMPEIYSAFTSSNTNRNLFSATVTAFDVFGERTETRADDAFAFRWADPSGALAPFADLFNFAYIGNLRTRDFLDRATTLTSTNAIQHTNVPVPAGVYLFSSALLFLRRAAIGGRRKMIA